MQANSFSLFVTDFLETLSLHKHSFTNRTLLHKIYTALAIIMVIALLPLPATYYFLLKLITFVGVGIFAFKLYEATPLPQNAFLFASLVFLVILYNPLVIIHLGSKLFWIIINIGTLFALYTTRQKLGD